MALGERERELLRRLLHDERVLSLAVLVEDRPQVGLLPFAMEPGWAAALVHSSALARHSRGLADGAPFSALIHAAVGADPLQVPRLTLEGAVAALDKGSDAYRAAAATYQARFPSSAVTFSLGDFRLWRLQIESGRLVGGFARAATVTAHDLAAAGDMGE